MTSAGNTAEAVRALQMLQQKTDKAFSFLKTADDEDRLQHIRDLKFHMKGTVNNIMVSGTQIRNYPCITKVFEPVPDLAKGEFPKEKTKDPMTCAKVLYVLYNNYPDKSLVRYIGDKAFQCKAQCDFCYKLAFEEYYRYGVLRCKK